MDKIVSGLALEVDVLPEYASNLSDDALLVQCLHYGEEARKWRNRFLGLLPEVARRRLYEKKGFGSIFHFAFVIGGVSGKQVERVLRLHKRFQMMPRLQILLESGAVGVHKMERIESIAEPENQEFLADQVQILSKKALDTLVKDQKRPMAEFSYVRKLEFVFANDIEQELSELHEKGIDINGELRKFLSERRARIAGEKGRLAMLMQDGDSVGRYVPVAVRNILREEYGKKCSINGCIKPSVDIHHQQRFGYVLKHDPRYMVPFCREHHQIAHSIDVKVQEMKKSRPP